MFADSHGRVKPPIKKFQNIISTTKNVSFVMIVLSSSYFFNTQLWDQWYINYTI